MVRSRAIEFVFSFLLTPWGLDVWDFDEPLFLLYSIYLSQGIIVYQFMIDIANVFRKFNFYLFRRFKVLFLNYIHHNWMIIVILTRIMIYMRCKYTWPKVISLDAVFDYRSYKLWKMGFKIFIFLHNDYMFEHFQHISCPFVLIKSHIEWWWDPLLPFIFLWIKSFLRPNLLCRMIFLVNE